MKCYNTPECLDENLKPGLQLKDSLMLILKPETKKKIKEKKIKTLVLKVPPWELIFRLHIQKKKNIFTGAYSITECLGLEETSGDHLV